MSKEESPALPVSAAALDILPTCDGYERWSTIYDGEDNPLILMEEPKVDHLLGDVSSLTVADVGCGTGRHALRLAKAGARVTGVDFSEGMLRLARGKPGSEAIRFVYHNLAAPLPFAGESFDRVLSCLVTEHLADLESHFRDLKRICRRDGFVVVSAMHPAMMLRGITARFTDPATGRETRPFSFPHQVSDYVMAVTRAGLTFDHLSEHAVTEDVAAQSPRARKYLGWPMLLVMRLAQA